MLASLAPTKGVLTTRIGDMSTLLDIALMLASAGNCPCDDGIANCVALGMGVLLNPVPCSMPSEGILIAPVVNAESFVSKFCVNFCRK